MHGLYLPQPSVAAAIDAYQANPFVDESEFVKDEHSEQAHPWHWSSASSSAEDVAKLEQIVPRFV